jgi:hypothetical protein
MWLAGETEVLGEILSRRHFVHHKSHLSDRARTLADAVGSQRLTASAMARPLWHVSIFALASYLIIIILV